jgi:hypothetical protein
LEFNLVSSSTTVVPGVWKNVGRPNSNNNNNDNNNYYYYHYY